MKYGAILADPPWPFDTYSRKGVVPARGEQPYPTMTIGEIAALPIPKLADRNCALFLWQSDSLPGMAEMLARVWGMRVVTDNVFIWFKDSIGMGYWTRKQAETCALLIKGQPGRRDKGVRQCHTEPRREHSRKPDEFYSRIERLVDGPYLELFARQRRPGWDACGNETDKFGWAAE